jgi:pyrimidine operon attenuation protein / uracil phosphoribosyltransferase
MIILNHHQIKTIIKRMAIQIKENHFGKEIYLAGINNKGYHLAELFIKNMDYEKASLFRLKLDPASPLHSEPQVDIDINQLKEKHIVIVDDVGNTGRTLFYGMKPFMNILPASIQAAVLVERMHKAYPIHVDYVGLQLATTLGENIEVDLSNSEQYIASLQ